MSSRLALLALGSVLLVHGGAAAQSDEEALRWLQRVRQATQKLSYSGTFLYQHDNQVETSRVVRRVRPNGVEERLESLDGEPREVIRTEDKVVCYLPNSMTVKVDKLSARKSFPAILPERIEDLAQNYIVRRGGTERVARFECQTITIEPRDRLRYGHRLCADLKTGMLLRSVTTDELGRVIESFAFAELKVGGDVERELRSRYRGFRPGEWKVEDSGAVETGPGETGWGLRAQPQGFRKLAEMTRTVGTTAGVGHLVLTDGLAAVSVFVEPASGPARQPGLSRQGAVNIYSREQEGHWITVVGEAPAESVIAISNALERRRPQ